MNTPLTRLLVVVAAAGSVTAFAGQQPAPATPPPPPAFNPDMHYQLGPDSLPREGVPKGEVRGPFTLPSEAYPGTQHTYWVYVPAQYDPKVPASLMVFNDGQAFKNMDGDLRAPNVLDNLIYRREIPVMVGGVHQPRPAARSAGADAAELGRPRHQPACGIQLARRQVCARHRRRAAARAEQGLQHREGSRAPRHRRRELRRDRRVHRGVGASQRVPQGAEHRSAASRTCAAATRTPTSSARARRSRCAIYLQDGRNDNRGVGRGGTYDETRDWFFQNVRLMKALSEKGYDLNYTWGIGRHGQKQARRDHAGHDALALARPPGVDGSQRHDRAWLQRAESDSRFARRR